jgi:hypothetical protein
MGRESGLREDGRSYGGRDEIANFLMYPEQHLTQSWYEKADPRPVAA